MSLRRGSKEKSGSMMREERRKQRMIKGDKEEEAHTFRICNIVNGVAVSEGFHNTTDNYFCAGGNGIDSH